MLADGPGIIGVIPERVPLDQAKVGTVVFDDETMRRGVALNGGAVFLFDLRLGGSRT